MTTVPNDLEWPSIQQLPRHVSFHYNKHAENDTTDEYIRQHIDNSVCYAMEKIDGTNVAVGADGRLFGRRTTIPSDAVKYSSVDIAELRLINVSGVHEHFLSLLGSDTNAAELVNKFRLYGELGCNKVMYDYAEKGFANTWQCFGACFEIKEEMAQVCVARIQEAGFCAFAAPLEGSTEIGKSRVTMPFCKMFVDMLDSFEIPHPPLFFTGSFRDLVQYSKEWMSSNTHEGLVVVMKTSPEDHQEGAHVIKWKQGHEKQPTGIQELQTVIQKAAAAELTTLADIFADLLNVAKTNNIEVVKSVAKKGAAPKVPRAMLIDPELVDSAIMSALTKYDSLETFFETPAQKKNIVGILFGEVEPDLSTELGADVVTKQAKNEIRAAISQFVGKRYGAYMKSRQDIIA